MIMMLMLMGKPTLMIMIQKESYDLKEDTIFSEIDGD